VTFLRKLIRGAASTSYGIYCARIAGLPEPIIERAYSLLGEFEARAALRLARDEAAAAEAPPVEGGASAVQQLSLFGGEASPPNKLAPAAAAAKAKPPKADAAAEKLLEQLRAADLINMTPMQAMNLLFDLKRQV
jgi:DNA mismatch repair protein MutS